VIEYLYKVMEKPSNHLLVKERLFNIFSSINPNV
jgi:hypothetical protein